MRILHALLVTVCALVPAVSAGEPRPLRFAWPVPAQAIVQQDEVRTVAGVTRSSVVTMRLRVEPDADRLVVRFSDARIVSVNGVPVDKVDPRSLDLAVARIRRRSLPTIVVSTQGYYLESRDVGRVVRAVIEEAGFPRVALPLESFSSLVTDVAASDWNAWVETWIGADPTPGAWTRIKREMEIEGRRLPVEVTRRGLEPGGAPGRGRLRLETEYPATSVRRYTTGLLIDMAREAEELSDDVFQNARFIESAQFSPVTETLTAEIETATLRPLIVERVRSFRAEHGRFEVEGTERRTHRFRWEKPTEPE